MRHSKFEMSMRDVGVEDSVSGDQCLVTDWLYKIGSYYFPLSFKIFAYLIPLMTRLCCSKGLMCCYTSLFFEGV